MLRREVLELRDRLNDSAETLRAISHGEVDALLISVAAGDEQVFTLSSADRPYRNFVENMSDGAATVSGDGIVLYANQALADLIGSRCQHIVGQPLLNLVALTNHARLGTLIRPGSVGGSVEANLLSSDGVPVPVLIGASAGFDIDDEHVTCVTFTDLTSERQADARAAHAAQHDALTGLLNRTLLRDRIEHALGRRASERSLVALLFCDVDGFKNINDSHGHQVGDDTLLVIAERLTSALRPEDTVARIGGDEFVVLLEGFETVSDVTTVARRVHAKVAAPMTWGPTEQVTISMGIAIASATDLGASPESLLRDADEAMYKAKRQGPNVIEMFDEQLRKLAASRLQLLSEMRDAAADGELRLYYQPVLDLRQERIVGVEALIRWQHPRRGLIPPNEFIPFAERSGLIIPIGAWALREACEQASRWKGASPAGQQLHMSVNVSGRQLGRSAGLVQAVERALLESGLDPTVLTLEVTESSLMQDAEVALRQVNQLKELGIRIAIDDFGTGYSSLVYLKRFPVDSLKIDRSFISGLGVNNDDTAIVRSVIELAGAFGIDTVAEGIETPQQLATLQNLHCAYG